ncbi:MAG: DUF4838 domain-containing protein [Lentisphaeria bacterium]|nr:DUF4838 domain-containing protein [Lentisphaeria bacterium]
MKKFILCLLFAIATIGLRADIVRISPAEKPIVIVIPPKANHGIRYAAQELSYHIGKATGAKVEIVTKTPSEDNKFIISLGETDFARANGVTGVGMKHNHARVVGDDDKLIISGNDRGNNLGALLIETSGTLVAVYNILENYNGVRWLFPGEAGEVIPKSDTFNFKGGDWVSKTKLRFFFWRQQWALRKNWSNEADFSNYMHHETIWLVRHRSNRDLSEQHYPHGFEKWPAKYLNSNVEFFNLLPDGTRRSDPYYWGGQSHLISMCTSNQSFREQIVKDWIASYNPNIPRINLKCNDTSWKCTCPDCMAEDESAVDSATRLSKAKARFAKGDRHWVDELGSATNRVIKFYKAVEKIADEMAPEKQAKFSGLIYANSAEAPAAGTYLGNRYQLCFCPPYMFPFPQEKVEKYKQMWSGWAATGCDLVIRPNFTLDGHCYPINYARMFYDIFTHAEQNNLTGSDYDSLTGMFGANGLTLYTIARLQNSEVGSLTFEDIENEYCSAFGNAASDIKRYFDRTEAVSLQAAEQARAAGEEGGNWTGYYLIGHKLFTPEVFAELTQILKDAEASAAGDEQSLRRVKFMQIGLENARLTGVVAGAFEKYKSNGDYVELAAALRDLDNFREENARSYAFNAGYANVRENAEWPRAAMAALNENTKALPLKWKFATDPDKQGFANGFANLDFDDSAWTMIRTDKTWEEQGFADYNGFGWYRLIIDIPANCTEQPVLIVGAADEAAEVYINGKKVLDRPYPYKGNPNSYAESFEVPWNPIPGKNIIAVKVIDNIGVGGITKPCYLKFEEKIDRENNVVKDSTFSDAASAWQFHKRVGLSEFAKKTVDGKNAAVIKAVGKSGNKLYLNKYNVHSLLYQKVNGLKVGQEYELIITFRTDDKFDGELLVFSHADTQTARKSDANIQIDASGKKLRWTTVSKKFIAKRDFASLYLNLAANKGELCFAEVLIVPVKAQVVSDVEGNLVKNGIFKGGDNWAFHRRIGQTKVSFTSDKKLLAATISAVQCDASKKYIGRYSMHSLLHQKVQNIVPGKTYKLQVTYRTKDNFDGQLLVFCHASSKGGKNAGNIELSGTAANQQKTLEATFVADKATADIYLNYAANKGSLVIYNVAVTEVE